MDAMTTTPQHAKPARRDLMWFLIAILACGLLEVWASWLQIGAVSGFPKLGRMTTGWILPVTSEAYWVAALYAWLADPAGPRSRKFAMWSAVGVFLLSLAGQESDHLLAAAGRTVPPAGVVGFVTALPLIAVALIAILIHLRQKDRDEAQEAGERSAAQAEMDALRTELAAAYAAREEDASALAAVRAELAEAVARTETLTRKLEAATARKRRTATARKPAPATGRKQEPVTASATAPEADAVTAPDDLDSEAKVLWYLEKGYSASKAGEKAGLSDSRGRQIARLRKPAQVED